MFGRKSQRKRGRSLAKSVCVYIEKHKKSLIEVFYIKGNSEEISSVFCGTTEKFMIAWEIRIFSLPKRLLFRGNVICKTEHYHIFKQCICMIN